MNSFTRQQKKDLKVLAAFIELYCRDHHRDREAADLPGDLAGSFTPPRLCPECGSLFSYGIERRRRCPLDPKPSCKDCRVHCFGREYREKIRRIMAYSGRKMILRGRLDYLWHYYF